MIPRNKNTYQVYLYQTVHSLSTILYNMEGECFNCANAATHRYTLVLASGKIFEEKFLCEGCSAAFQHDDWIELQETPLLMRGNTTTPTDNDTK